jgi:hypothetical protein
LLKGLACRTSVPLEAGDEHPLQDKETHCGLAEKKTLVTHDP